MGNQGCIIKGSGKTNSANKMSANNLVETKFGKGKESDTVTRHKLRKAQILAMFFEGFGVLRCCRGFWRFSKILDPCIRHRNRKGRRDVEMKKGKRKMFEGA